METWYSGKFRILILNKNIIMKIQELRIGNLVNWKENEIHINAVDLHQMSDSKQYLEEFTPILLTPKWLIKFGFKEKKTKLEEIYRLEMFEYATSCKTIDLEFENTENHITYTTDVKYVHELQNLFFALTGKELSVKNKK